MAKNTDKTGNRFSEMKGLLLQSVGRIPAGLVILLAMAVSLAAISGLMMAVLKPDRITREFLPLRIESVSVAPQIDKQALQGSWVISTTEYAMSISFINDRFEWLLKFSDIPDAQYFARGNYRIAGDVIILGVRTDFGVPYNEAQPWVKYLPLSLRDLNTYVILAEKRMVWDVPTSEQALINGQGARIFMREGGATSGNLQWIRR